MRLTTKEFLKSETHKKYVLSVITEDKFELVFYSDTKDIHHLKKYDNVYIYSTPDDKRAVKYIVVIRKQVLGTWDPDLREHIFTSLE